MKLFSFLPPVAGCKPPCMDFEPTESIKSSPPPENSPENSAVIFSPPPPPDADFLARQRAARAQRKRLAEERDKLFIEFFGQPAADKVIVPLGSMVVTLSLKFDNSDSMTDYFDRHAPPVAQFRPARSQKAERNREARPPCTRAGICVHPLWLMFCRIRACRVVASERRPVPWRQFA